MDQSQNNIYQQLDSQIGTATRVPRLLRAEDFAEWKWRFEHQIKYSEPKIWRSIKRGPREITYIKDDEKKTKAIKTIDMYTDADFDIVEEDEKALSSLTMALVPEIAKGFKNCTSAKQLWEALIDVYEGNKDMKDSRRDMLSQQFNMFNHILGESLEAQIQRFVSLATDMASAEIVVTNGDMNKKLLNSLPHTWDFNVALIKKTKDLYTITLTELISTIKSYAIEDKQRAINHASSLSNAGMNQSNTAFVSQEHSSKISVPVSKSTVSSSSSSTTGGSSSVMSLLNLYIYVINLQVGLLKPSWL